MAQQSYNYAQREGIHPISWNTFHGLCKGLAQAVSSYQPEVILPIGRGGFYPGTLLAHMLRAEVYPIRLSRRVADVVTHQTPQWLLEPPALINGRRVLIVDEISSSGQTLQIVKEKVLALGAAEVRSAVLYAHTWGIATPDYIGLISDALLLNPWDREVWQDGRFTFHPEYADAFAKQGFTLDDNLRVDAPCISVAKG